MVNQVKVYGDAAALSQAVADEFIRLAKAAIAERGRFTVALAGGRTPKALYQLLAEQYSGAIDWTQVHLFFGDERYVPPDHPLSNFRMVRDVLRLGHMYRMDTGDVDPDLAAAAYAEKLRIYNALPFDLVLLGMGTDGHTASLFPGTTALAERDRWVVAVEAAVEPPVRLSLTLPLLTGARQCIFLVTGADKREVLRAILADPLTAGERYPAALVYGAGHATWYIDEAANPS
jgi:6-phosphogluconolactonase